MIILPERNLPRAKFLLPVHDYTWRSPSQAQPKDQLGNSNCTRFRVRARLNDGYIIWQGWFEDRSDADAFLFSILTGNIRHEKALWNLCTPEWNDSIPETCSYEFHSLTFLSAGAGDLQEWVVPNDWTNPLWMPPFITEGDEYLFWSGSPSYLTTGTSDTVPSNWNDSINTIEGIGGGGGGGICRATSGNRSATGGGGGAYAKISNLALTKGASVSYTVGTGGTAVSRSTDGSTSGNQGNNTTFNTTSLIAVGGNGGAGNTNANTNGGAGGTGSTGTTTYDGGRGGNNNNSGTARYATGGGGAAGLHGAGNNGADNNGTTSNLASNGGSGDAGFGGSTGNGNASGNGTAGGDGTEYSSSPVYGSGGGGGGGLPAVGTNGNGGSGGKYGGGGGACVTNGSNPTGGAGIQGLIVITYTPITNIWTNMPMLGM